MNGRGIQELESPEVRGKLLQFHRVLMSYIDFQQAAEIASYILGHNLHERQSGDRLLLRSLNTAMVIAYCRPFSKNERGGDSKVPNLSERFLRVLTIDERKLHDDVREDRNTALAHSDSAAWGLRLQILRLDIGDTLVPVHRDVHASLTRDAAKKFQGMCIKLREACFEERLRLEPELRPYLEVVEPDLKELKRTADELGISLPPEEAPLRPKTDAPK